jgi:hypothetical protein
MKRGLLRPAFKILAAVRGILAAVRNEHPFFQWYGMSIRVERAAFAWELGQVVRL